VKRREERGQGTVELAIGLLVFVTVLIFGIHFAELSFLSLKTTEAASYAIWDSTGRRVHRFDPNRLGSSTQIYSVNSQVTGGADPTRSTSPSRRRTSRASRIRWAG
jgi:hypothetical protein